MLRRVRIAVAAALFVCENLFFIGVGGGLGVFEKFQLVPALLAMNVAALVTIGAVTLLCGRVYCSTLCPLGVFQDAVIGLARAFAKKRFAYAPAHAVLRYGVLAAVAAAFAVGFASVPALLDPYSLYGRMAANLLQPVAHGANNVAAWIADSLGRPLIFKREVFIRSALALSVAAASLVAIGFLAVKRGRLYCNTLCPAGSLLAALSHRPLLRIVIDAEACTGCGLCARACKAECIDAQARAVDLSRCVSCFDCLSACRKGAVRYGVSAAAKGLDAKGRGSVTGPAEKEAGLGRRGFVMGAAVTSATAAAAMTRKSGAPVAAPEPPVSPPGSGGRERLLAQCTSCNLCAARCEGQVIKPAQLEYGLGGVLMPLLDFSRGYCGWDCNACGKACPSGAIAPLTLEEKRQTRIGRAVYVRAQCVLVTDGVQTCGNCAEHCPTKALTLAEEKDKKKYPRIDERACIGCGACEYHCPAKPRAIHVAGLGLPRKGET